MKYEKEILAYGLKYKVGCDGNCKLSKGDKNTYEGGQGFYIVTKSEFPTKWCFRQCDRCLTISRKLSKENNLK